MTDQPEITDNNLEVAAEKPQVSKDEYVNARMEFEARLREATSQEPLSDVGLEQSKARYEESYDKILRNDPSALSKYMEVFNTDMEIILNLAQQRLDQARIEANGNLVSDAALLRDLVRDEYENSKTIELEANVVQQAPVEDIDESLRHTVMTEEQMAKYKQEQEAALLQTQEFLQQWYEKHAKQKLDEEQARMIAEKMKQDDAELFDRIAGGDITSDSLDDLSEEENIAIEQSFLPPQEDNSPELQAGAPIVGASVTPLGRTNGLVAKILPIAAGIGAGVLTRQIGQVTLAGMSILPGGFIGAAALGAVAGSVAELTKLHFRQRALRDQFPDASRRDRMRMVLKQDQLDKVARKMQKLQNKSGMDDDAYEAQKQKLMDDLAKIPKGEAIARKRMLQNKLNKLEDQRNGYPKQMESLQRQYDSIDQKDLSKFSVAVHVSKQGLLAGALSAATFGVLNGEFNDLVEKGREFFNENILGSSFFAESNASDVVAGAEIATEPSADAVTPQDVPGTEEQTLSQEQRETLEAQGATPEQIATLETLQLDGVDITSPEALAVATAVQEAGFEVLRGPEAITSALEEHFNGDVPEKFASYIANLDHENPNVAAEARHSIAFLLIENNTEFAKEGHKDLASAIMTGNVLDHGFDPNNHGLARSWDGLRAYQSDVAQAMSEYRDVALSDVKSYAAESVLSSPAAATNADPWSGLREVTGASLADAQLQTPNVARNEAGQIFVETRNGATIIPAAKVADAGSVAASFGDCSSGVNSFVDPCTPEERAAQFKEDLNSGDPFAFLKRNPHGVMH